MTLSPRAIFISHGGGPLPLLGDPGHSEMVACLAQMAADIPRPDAIVVASAHWEEAVPTITAQAKPPLIYDYYGFPPESYEIQYPAVGEPALAGAIHGMLSDCGIEAKLDDKRGFDHGMYVPLKIMYPEADIPCVQISLVKSLDAAFHIDIGVALQKLTEQNVLLMGSGFSFHNMRAFFAPAEAETTQLNEAFEAWLHETCASKLQAEVQRRERLIRWADAPGARYCHPREEHLLPLHVCYGAAQAPSTEVIQLPILDKQSSMIVW